MTGNSYFVSAAQVVNQSRRFVTDAAQSRRDFKIFVAPVLEKIFEGEVIGVETRDDPLAKFLDCRVGVDYLVRDAKGHLFGLSSRVQRTARPWRTFTIREHRPNGKQPSEMTRLLGGGLVDYFAQSYIADDGRTVIGVVRASDLAEYLRGGQYERKKSYSGETFAVVLWRDLQEAGVRLVVVE